MNIPRPEYPRPQFVRKDWLNLNGCWAFSFDRPDFDREIVVPFAYQAALSGLGTSERHNLLWYRRSFSCPEAWAGRVVLLHFGAVDYRCRVWVNDCLVGEHAGGHVSFSLDITQALRTGENTLTVEVTDVLSDLAQPRGKQYWKPAPEGIYYTATSGIWQTVWLEAVPQARLCGMELTPDYDRRALTVDYHLSAGGLEVELDARFQGAQAAFLRTKALRREGTLVLTLDPTALGVNDFAAQCAWTPEHPWLFDLTCRIYQDGILTDTVESYFGMRKVAIEDGLLMLNGVPYEQRLLLDQGYWRDSLLTAPTDEAFREDIRLCREMGFNGVRKHQKVEDPRFLYHADRMGLLVWGEMAAAHVYTAEAVNHVMQEWTQAVRRDYNHPCIVAWTPLNESWGVPDIRTDARQAYHSRALVALTKSLDATRPVSANDGWEQTDTDILGIHDYESDPTVLQRRYGTLEEALSFRPAGRPLFVGGSKYAGQPILVTECGGIAFDTGADGWGYTNADSEEAFLRAYAGIVGALRRSPVVQGFCYTQLTDVQQEKNGLLDFDHRPKFNCAAIRKINEDNGILRGGTEK